MAGGKSKFNHGTYDDKKSGMPGAKVDRGGGKPSTKGLNRGTYSSKGSGMPGAKVDRGS